MGRTIVLQVARPEHVARASVSAGRDPVPEPSASASASVSASSSASSSSSNSTRAKSCTNAGSKQSVGVPAAVDTPAPRTRPPTPPGSPDFATLGLRRSRRHAQPAQHKGSVPVPLTAPPKPAEPQPQPTPAPAPKKAPSAPASPPDTNSRAGSTTSDAFDSSEATRSALQEAAAISWPDELDLPDFARLSKDPVSDLGKLFDAVQSSRRIAVVTGAGISVAPPANIPDFRSSEGLFRKLKQQHPDAGLSSGKDLFDARLFTSSKTTGLFYSMVSELKRMADQAQPTAFHHMLKMFDEQGRLLRVYTQNIDGLEAKAGLTFGLGHVGDSTSAQRALGKRKRGTTKQPSPEEDGLTARRSFARSQSDSALLWSTEPDKGEAQPMFPRCIPLHGSLHTLTCSMCSCTLDLSPLPPGKTEEQREGFPPKGSGATVVCPADALQLLQSGEPVPCPRCEVSDEVRTANGLRSRGIGKMKVDVVLYGGQNESAERVGECLGRDILGLRDPGEPPVPETARETLARVNKDKKVQSASHSRATSKLVTPKVEEQDSTSSPTKTFPSKRRTWTKTQSESSLNLSVPNGVPTTTKKEKPSSHTAVGLQTVPETDSDQVLQGLFSNDDGHSMPEHNAPAPAAPAPHRKKRAEKLKAMPPDLLIVAGTSLKVPGTKRIVREFAKACHARDARWYPNTYNSAPAPGQAKRQANRASKRGNKTEFESDSESDASQRDDSGYNSEEEYERLPIRTVLINADFPHPSKEWAGVFDIWLQGDVQAAALGLAPTYDAAQKEVSNLTLASSSDPVGEPFQLSDQDRGKYAPDPYDRQNQSWIEFKRARDWALRHGSAPSTRSTSPALSVNSKKSTKAKDESERSKPKAKKPATKQSTLGFHASRVKATPAATTARKEGKLSTRA